MQPNVVALTPTLQLRWGSAATSGRGASGTGLIADAPIFLLTDPEGLVATRTARRLVDGFTALAGTLHDDVTAEQVERIWKDAIASVERELAEVTMVGAGDFDELEVPAAMLVAILVDGEPHWLIHSSAGAVILEVDGDDVAEVSGDMRLAPMVPGVRYVLMTKALARALSSGRVRNVVTQLVRAERAAAVLVSQTPPSTNDNQGVIVVDALAVEQAAKLEFPATIGVAPEDADALAADAGGQDEEAELTSDWALKILGIDSFPTNERGGSHGRRSLASPPEIDDFTFVSYLGSGGFSDVYLYEEHLPKRLVAIKVLSKDAVRDGETSSFRAEVDLMAQLSGHPSVVSIFDANVATTGQPYIVMQFCPLPSLAEQLARGPLDAREGLRLGVQLSGAVQTAHVLGIVHHDLKPANALTTEFGRVVLGDFGIASLVGASTRQVAGMSLPWAAPEVLRSETAGRPADIYSLAATVYTALYGQAPFAIAERTTRAAYKERVLAEQASFFDIPGVPDEAMARLREVLAGGLEKAVAARTATAGDFGKGLQDVQRLMGEAATELEIPRT